MSDDYLEKIDIDKFRSPATKGEIAQVASQAAAAIGSLRVAVLRLAGGEPQAALTSLQHVGDAVDLLQQQIERLIHKDPQ